MADKRDLGPIFRTRLAGLVTQSGGSQSRFAASIGLDRSALSQLLSDKGVRLPRAETLVAIAEVHGVSLDWLLGLSQDAASINEMAPILDLERSSGQPDDGRLQQWRRESAGYKIRYVPATLPDPLRTEAVIRYELGRETADVIEASIADAGSYLEYSRRPETDMEVCLPLQRLDAFARGEDVWADLPRRLRREQLLHMARLLDELYPTFRLFLYDGRRLYSAPFTVFGPRRAAVYLGDMFLVLNATDHIRVMIDRFDALIRRATVNPHEAAGHVARLAETL